jgi:hypothetical protein
LVREGSSENSRVATDLLRDLVDRGIKQDRLRLFVIDGSKASRCAIDAVFGPPNPDRLFDVPMAGLIHLPFLSSH